MCSSSFTIKEIHIKTTKWHHDTGATLTKKKKMYDPDVSKDEEKLELVSIADEGVCSYKYFEKLFNSVCWSWSYT